MTQRSRNTAAARTAERGFTLGETAFALLIMMIASIGVVSLFSYAIKYNEGAKDRELAMAVAQQRMEWLRGIPYDATTCNQAFHYPTAASPAGGGLAATPGVTETVQSGGRSFEVLTTIVNVGNTTNANSKVKTITVQVTPKGAGNVLGRVALVTQRSILTLGSN